ncbi:MAG: hypothetical protein HKN48_08405 [Flavobacteriaceae bacterium]|nr:hypothetical protein [Flavobacteriaceae bacterium]
MKKLLSITLTSVIALLLLSCGEIGEKKSEEMDVSDFKTEKVEGMYEVSVPKYMKEAFDLNDDASLQFQNIYKETYLAIIDESKADFIEVFKELNEYDDGLSVAGNYRNIQMQYFTEGIRIDKRSEPRKLTINGLEAEQVEFNGRVPEVDYDIYYLMTFIEGEENVYMMMEWTLASFEDKFKGTFKQMAETFREI